MIALGDVWIIALAFGLLMALSDAIHLGISVFILVLSVFARWALLGSWGDGFAFMAVFIGFILAFFHHYVRKTPSGEPEMARADVWLFMFFSYWLGSPGAAMAAYAVVVYLMIVHEEHVAVKGGPSEVPLASYYFIAFLIVTLTNGALAGALITAGHEAVIHQWWYRLLFYTPQT